MLYPEYDQPMIILSDLCSQLVLYQRALFNFPENQVGKEVKSDNFRSFNYQKVSRPWLEMHVVFTRLEAVRLIRFQIGRIE